MRKIITVRLWIEDEDPDTMSDDYVERDVMRYLTGRHFYHDFELLSIEQMEIMNEKANLENPACDPVRA